MDFFIYKFFQIPKNLNCVFIIYCYFSAEFILYFNKSNKNWCKDNSSYYSLTYSDCSVLVYFNSFIVSFSYTIYIIFYKEGSKDNSFTD